VGSSLTAVDLRGLTRVELGFGLVLASAAAGLVVGLGLAERRRTFAVVAALGARPRQLAAFVRSDALLVAVAGLTAGALIAGALSIMLVKVLTGVFDPPPSSLAVPVLYVAGVATLAVVAAGAAAEVVRRAGGRRTGELLRDM
jgi:putative ABC transport system permease protein